MHQEVKRYQNRPNGIKKEKNLKRKRVAFSGEKALISMTRKREEKVDRQNLLKIFLAKDRERPITGNEEKWI